MGQRPSRYTPQWKALLPSPPPLEPQAPNHRSERGLGPEKDGCPPRRARQGCRVRIPSIPCRERMEYCPGGTSGISKAQAPGSLRTVQTHSSHALTLHFRGRKTSLSPWGHLERGLRPHRFLSSAPMGAAHGPPTPAFHGRSAQLCEATLGSG